MIENVLIARGVKEKTIISTKTWIAVGLIAMAVALPQLFHATMGATSGMTWLPMYLPVILAGCLLGYKFGLLVGLFAPLVSYAFTALALGSAMPVLGRLPFMIAELAVFGLISGLFSKKIFANPLMAFPAVIMSEVCGRGLFLLSVLIFEKVSILSVSLVLSQLKSGLVGLAVWAVLAPMIVILIKRIMDNANRDSSN